MNRWPSFEEYKDWVYPDSVDHPGPWRNTYINPLFDNILEIAKCLQRIEQNLRPLSSMFDDWPVNSLPQEDVLDRAYVYVLDIAWDAEHLFLYDPEFAKTEAAADFRSEKGLHHHWERYKSTPRKLYSRLEKFIEETGNLIGGFHAFHSEAESFLLAEAKDLPEELTEDFRTARDLFSVGLEEGGAFFAGRGLEAVLCQLARSVKLQIEQKGKAIPPDELGLAVIGEAFRRARWKSDGTPVIDKKVKSLLDLLRNARNATAHPPNKKLRHTDEQDWREIARLSAKAANALWLASGKGRRKLASKTIVKDW